MFARKVPEVQNYDYDTNKPWVELVYLENRKSNGKPTTNFSTVVIFAEIVSKWGKSLQADINRVKFLST